MHAWSTRREQRSTGLAFCKRVYISASGDVRNVNVCASVSWAGARLTVSCDFEVAPKSGMPAGNLDERRLAARAACASAAAATYPTAARNPRHALRSRRRAVRLLPALHQRDLVALRGNDPARELA